MKPMRIRAERCATSLARPAHVGERQATVLLAGKAGVIDAPGGGATRIRATLEALRSLGVEARNWRPQNDSLAGIDCVHLFGSEPEHLALIAMARRRNLPVLLSPIAWFELAPCLRELHSWPQRLTASAHFLARAACPRLPSWRRRLYHEATMLLPHSNAEARQLVRHFQVPAAHIHVVPDGADARFADADPELFIRRVGIENFVLYVGGIEPRKNQLGFLQAMRDIDLPIVVLGDVVPGHEAYLAECHHAAGPCVQFIHQLDHHDSLLASAYAACGCLVLTSYFETPGLVALEAGMSGTPLVLPLHGCANEYFGPMAHYVRPNDSSSIRDAVFTAMAHGRDATLARQIRENFTWRATALATREAYRRVLHG